MRLRHRPWSDVLIAEHPEFVITREHLNDSKLQEFIQRENLALEIGSGKGDFIIEMAKKYPNYYFLGVEMNMMALAITLRKLVATEIKNILLVSADVSNLFEVLPDEKFEAIFLNFSDPWPKKRQHKRRLTYPTFLHQYERLLKNGGTLAFKTDNDVLFEDSLLYLDESSLKKLSVDKDYDGNDALDAPTEYERKFRALGTKIKRYVTIKE